MSGETDLQKLLTALRPCLSQTAYAFAVVTNADEIRAETTILATFAEDEGLTIIGPFDELAWPGLDRSGPWARISFGTHSSLFAVGLTAKITSALSDHGISANVIAAFFHDHIFVPWEKRHTALEVLKKLG